MKRSYRFLLILICSIYVLISHVFIPRFNNGRDFLFFTHWHLFAYKTQNFVYDLTWDHGETFFFRDYTGSAQGAGIDTHIIFYLVNFGHLKEAKKLYSQSLHQFCHCEKLKLVKMSGSFYQYIIRKQKLPIIKISDL